MRKGIVAIAFAAALVAASPLVLADEIVHFANGAEMAVRSHVVQGDMVKLDLGGNSFISFPLTMVDSIASAGRNVFVNEAYHPANQAVEGQDVASRGAPPIPVQDLRSFGGGGNVGFRRYPGKGARDGTALGEPVIGSSSDQYTRDNGVTTVRDANGHGVLSHVARPKINSAAPLPEGGVGVIDLPQQPPPARGRQFLPKVIAPPTPPPSDGSSQSSPDAPASN
jgi:hypothetical protein